MSGLRRGDMSMQRTREQIQIAHQIEHLVAREFVGEAQRGVYDFVVIHEEFALSRRPPLARPYSAELAELRTKPKVRAGAISRVYVSGEVSSKCNC